MSFDLHIIFLVSQAPVVQTLDSAIHRIKSIQWITQLVFLILILWIVIYPVDSANQRLNNRGPEVFRHANDIQQVKPPSNDLLSIESMSVPGGSVGLYRNVTKSY